jgi:hypothetical protein
MVPGCKTPGHNQSQANNNFFQDFQRSSKKYDNMTSLETAKAKLEGHILFLHLF